MAPLPIFAFAPAAIPLAEIGGELLGNEELDVAPVGRRGNVPTSPKLGGVVERVLGAVRNQRSGPGGRRERPPLGRRRSRRITRFGQSVTHRPLNSLFRGQRDAFIVRIESRAHFVVARRYFDDPLMRAGRRRHFTENRAAELLWRRSGDFDAGGARRAHS